jgi:eukaryotic-like serine/threonine-protein kinase
MASSPMSAVAQFGEFEANLRSRELRRNGSNVRLPGQSFEILDMLLQHPGELVTREEIRRRLWPTETFVDFDHGLNNAVNRLREALGDSAEAPRFIETLPRRGYRFVFPVVLPARMPNGAGVAETGSAPTEKATRPSGAAAIVATIIIVGLATFGWWSFSRNTQALTERDTIVLADFANTTGDQVFDDTLRQGLSIQLEQSPFLASMSDEKIQQTLKMMGQKQDAKLTPEITREVCQRTSSTAVLDGSIAQIGTQYLLTLKTVNCANGDLIASAAAQASDKSHVLDALGRASSDIRKKLGESLTSIQKFDVPLVQATTSSLDALKAFSVYARGRGLVPGIPVLLHVVELDPNFAGAYTQLAAVYSGIGETELASEYAQKAYDLRERVTQRERFDIMTTYYFATLGDLDQELHTYPVFEQMYPREWGPWNDSASSRRLLGDYAGALKEAQEALRLNPDTVNPYLNAGFALVSLDRRDEAKQIVQRALARGLDVPDMHILTYQVAFLENDAKEMEAQLGTLSGETREALSAQFSTEAYFGRLRNSLRFSRRVLEIAQRSNFNEFAAQIQHAAALLEAEFGNSGQARQAAATALTRSSGRRAKLFASLALARAGDVTRAQALADELNRQFPWDTLLQRYWLPTIRGSIELARKNPTRALEALQGVSYELGDVGFLVGNLYPVYVRGQAYLGTHQGKEAAAEFQKLLDHRSIVLNSPLGALAHLGLARAYSLQGDIVKAHAAYQNFVTLWKDADPDIPILKQAKAEYAKLQ